MQIKAIALRKMASSRRMAVFLSMVAGSREGIYGNLDKMHAFAFITASEKIARNFVGCPKPDF